MKKKKREKLKDKKIEWKKRTRTEKCLLGMGSSLDSPVEFTKAGSPRAMRICAGKGRR